ncbi:uncharacterized protein I303_104981 [Kwoniella dejecticola CBS 10117]|uniref:Uncharacterized protein n=1 Tax=Kwoniella dejecticola CBS 10117 TaxID=1296121 RepID=A0A1A6A3T1_9TREE|nr:uncharacterized protein I303_05574 [Kwoniella dejecticola CBS 10117]OBR84715.1 hypothetical protein I303_05574 [Kwoniella dejecticola CBS 10117]
MSNTSFAGTSNHSQNYVQEFMRFVPDYVDAKDTRVQESIDRYTMMTAKFILSEGVTTDNPSLGDFKNEIKTYLSWLGTENEARALDQVRDYEAQLNAALGRRRVDIASARGELDGLMG